MTWKNNAFPWQNPIPKVVHDHRENHSMEVLPDNDNDGGDAGGDSSFNEDAFLGQDGAFGPSDDAMSTGAPAQPQPVVPAPVVPAPQFPQYQQPQQPQGQFPSPPPTQDPAVDSAFAAQRRYYESLNQMQQQQLIDLNNRLAAFEARQAAPQQPQAPAAPPDPMPDPVDYPAEFAEWSIRQAESRIRSSVMSELAPVVQQVQGLNRNQEVSAYERSLQTAESRYGADLWNKLYAAAGEFARQYPSVRQDVFKAADQGQALAELGARALGIQLPQQGQQVAYGAPAPMAQPVGQPAGQHPQAAPQLTEQQIRADERSRAVREMMAQFQQNPYNLAAPSVSGLPSAPVVSGGVVRPGSAEEDALLGS